MSLKIQAVMNQLTEDLKREIIDFWLSERALSAEVAEQRVAEVLLLARESEAGPIIGVCTAYEQYIETLGLPMYMYRNYNRADNRSGGLGRQLFFASFGLLEGLHHARGGAGPCGILMEMENEWLKARDQLVWTDGKNLTFVGYSPSGAHMRLAYFKDARIPPRQAPKQV